MATDPHFVCGNCGHHGAPKPDMPGHADCRALPADRPVAVGRHHTYVYRPTADDLPACGLWKPVAEAWKPAIETKVPTIETKAAEPVVAAVKSTPVTGLPKQVGNVVSVTGSTAPTLDELKAAQNRQRDERGRDRRR